MALIKCPECDNKISDQAAKCPKCGYELNKKNEESKQENPKPLSNLCINKGNLKYLIIIAVVVVVGFLIFDRYGTNTGNTGTGTPGTGTQEPTSNPTTTPPTTNSSYLVYNDAYLGISFEYPSNYKVTTDKEGYIYVGKNIDSKGALIPYIIIGRYDKFTNEVQFLNSFTDYMSKQYNDLQIIINMLSGIIGNRTVYGIAYSYTSSNHLIIDNRYAVLVNNIVYMVGSKEENTNTAEINSVVEHILTTLTERGA